LKRNLRKKRRIKKSERREWSKEMLMKRRIIMSLEHSKSQDLTNLRNTKRTQRKESLCETSQRLIFPRKKWSRRRKMWRPQECDQIIGMKTNK